MKNWIKGHVYDFNVDYNDTAVDDVLGIDNYLMKKMGQYKVFKFVKKMFAATRSFFNCNLSNVNSLKCVSMNNQE